mgnify:CR=1 FL=1
MWDLPTRSSDFDTPSAAPPATPGQSVVLAVALLVGLLMSEMQREIAALGFEEGQPMLHCGSHHLGPDDSTVRLDGFRPCLDDAAQMASHCHLHREPRHHPPDADIVHSPPDLAAGLVEGVPDHGQVDGESQGASPLLESLLFHRPFPSARWCASGCVSRHALANRRVSRSCVTVEGIGVAEDTEGSHRSFPRLAGQALDIQVVKQGIRLRGTPGA